MNKGLILFQLSFSDFLRSLYWSLLSICLTAHQIAFYFEWSLKPKWGELLNIVQILYKFFFLILVFKKIFLKSIFQSYVIIDQIHFSTANACSTYVPTTIQLHSGKQGMRAHTSFKSTLLCQMHPSCNWQVFICSSQFRPIECDIPNKKRGGIMGQLIWFFLR